MITLTNNNTKSSVFYVTVICLVTFGIYWNSLQGDFFGTTEVLFSTAAAIWETGEMFFHHSPNLFLVQLPFTDPF